MDKYLLAQDSISGREGMAYVEIDGVNKPLFHAKNIKVEFEKNKDEFNSMNCRVTQSKTSGVTMTGSMEMYEGSPLFTDMFFKYLETGKDVYFNMRIVNDDPSSAAGRKAILLIDCNIDSGTLAALDIEENHLGSEVAFTLRDAKQLERYNEFMY